VEKGVALVGLALGLQLLGGHAQREVDEASHKGIDDAEVGAELPLGKHPTEVVGARRDVLEALHVVEGLGELLLGGALYGVSTTASEDGKGGPTYLMDLTSVPRRKSVATSSVYR
jgi:hypothetical protein